MSAPEVIGGSWAYFAAGADAVETNSFGVAADAEEYGLSARAREISRAATVITRAADERRRGRAAGFVLGSVGPGTKLVSLGQVGMTICMRGIWSRWAGCWRGRMVDY